jgi:hypothetical protein
VGDISFDPSKSDRNFRERGISFEIVELFDWAAALIVEDLRRDYGERRFQALGFIEGTLYAMVFTPRAGAVHVISLRRASRRERKRYEEEIGGHPRQAGEP